MEQLRGALAFVISVAHIMSLEAYLSTDGVPAKHFWDFESYHRDRQDRVRKALEAGDYETIKKSFSDIDLLEKDIFVAVFSSETLLEIVDERTSKKINFKKTYDTLRTSDGEHILFEGLDGQDCSKLNFFVAHGFLDDMLALTDRDGRTVFELAAESYNAQAARIYMDAQRAKNPHLIDRNARVAVNNVCKHCPSYDRPDRNCQAARDFFASYVTTLHEYGMLDEAAFMLDLARDEKNIVALEDVIQSYNKRAVRIDQLVDEKKNNLLQVALMHHNKGGIRLAVQAGISPEYKNGEGRSAADMVAGMQAVCFKISSDPASVRENLVRCKQAQELQDLVKSSVVAHEKELMSKGLEEKRQKLASEQQLAANKSSEAQKKIAGEQRNAMIKMAQYQGELEREVEELKKKTQFEQKKRDDLLDCEREKIAKEEKEFKELWGADDNDKK